MSTSSRGSKRAARVSLWRALFSTQGLSQALFISSTDVTPDDQRFVFVGPVGITGRELIVVENWFEELKAKVGDKFSSFS